MAIEPRPWTHQPKRRFGQHFLHDPAIIAKIINAVAPVTGQRVVEIGPGTGALTGPLLKRLGQLDVVELDRDLIEQLSDRFSALGTLRIHVGDALVFKLESLGAAPSKIRLVGNLPYNVATPLLFHFIDQLTFVDDMTFMVQREVADRMVANPGTSGYGRLSVMLQHKLEVETLFDVAPGAFRPPPQVHSSIVRLWPRKTVEYVQSQPLFDRVVRAAFSQRRKTLRNSLRGLVRPETFVDAGIDGGLRPEVLAIADFARLANLIASSAEQTANVSDKGGTKPMI